MLHWHVLATQTADAIAARNRVVFFSAAHPGRAKVRLNATGLSPKAPAVRRARAPTGLSCRGRFGRTSGDSG